MLLQHPQALLQAAMLPCRPPLPKKMCWNDRAGVQCKALDPARRLDSTHHCCCTTPTPTPSPAPTAPAGLKCWGHGNPCASNHATACGQRTGHGAGVLWMGPCLDYMLRCAASRCAVLCCATHQDRTHWAHRSAQQGHMSAISPLVHMGTSFNPPGTPWL